MKKLFIIYNILTYSLLNAQKQDTVRTRILSEITVVGQKSQFDIHQLPEIVGTNIYAGKKSALIVLDNVQGNTVTNAMRQVMAKVPGVFIWENESSGIQINIATRGLSPNRSWEFNVRQNGYDIAADPYGYPEAYYNPQLQSVQRIEVVRGHGALQYGPQIGGMINYILKNGSEFTKPFQFESFQTVGNNGLFNSYNAVGGNTRKLNYYAFFDHRDANGWRANNKYSSNTGSGTVTYHINDKFSVTTEFTRWHALSQQPGGLTDEQFNQDPQQSVRSRNWFDLTWQTVAVNADYKINSNQRINLKYFNIYGDRNSVGYFPSVGVTVPDPINSATGQYSNRTVDIDNYRNQGFELRYLLSYQTGKLGHNLSAGARLYRGNTYRYRGGKGTTGTNYDISVEGIYSSDIDYLSKNAAFFIENLFSLTERLLIIPGVRYEYLFAEAGGYNGLSNGNPVYLQEQQRNRGFVIGGLGLEYALTNHTKLYANATQSYRPVQFADLTTPPTTDEIDPNLTDAKGLNMDVGYRGSVKNHLIFDVSAFHLTYNNRVGTIKQQRNDGSFYNLRTNVGSSTAYGIEAFGELNITKALGNQSKIGEITVFASYAFNHAQYDNFKVITVVNNALSETNYKGKQVEYAPENILRTGFSYLYKGVTAMLQYSFTDQVFTDANNTIEPTSNAQNGSVPSYSILDATVGYRHKSGLSMKGGVNNLLNENYFTRRAGGYPGPGILPGDGITYFATLGFVLK